jgi:PAS domain S-box-containing protein
MNVDITARHEAEEALSERVARENLIVDAVPAMIGYIDRNTRFVSANAEYERFFGIPRSKLIGKTLREMMPPEAYLGRQPYLHAVLRGERVRFEGCVRDQFGPGRHGWTEESYVPDIGPSGEVRGFFVLAIDISARRHAEADLRLSEERYRLAVAAFQGGVSGYDPISGETWGTEGLFRLFGDPIPSGPGHLDDFFARVHPEDQPHVRAVIDRLVDEGRGPRDLEYRARHADGSWRVFWTRVTALPPVRRRHPLLAATIDITERSEWQARLATESERLRLALDVGQLATWDWDLQADTVSWNDHHYRLQGYVPGEIEPSYAAWAARVFADDYPDLIEAIDRARDGREEFAAVYRVRLPSGELRWCASRGRFFYDIAGVATRMIGVTIDITDERAAREAAAESERRLRSLMSAIPQLVFRAQSDGAMLWASPQWCAYTGLGADRSLGFGWLAAIHPEDQAATREAWATAATSGRYAVEHRIRHAGTGDWRWHQTQAVPVVGERGGAADWVGTSTDIDEVRRLQRRQQTLLAELQHRVRNSLGIIRSIVQRTAETSDSVETMAAHLNGRIGAFARVQGAVTRDPAGGVDLAGLIEDELLAYATREGPRLHIKGPRVLLGPRAAESMSLAIHELTTNAVKHGVLSERDGWIDIDWRIEDDDFRFSWKEAGRLQELTPPEGTGFGLELLLRSLPYDLGATTDVAFEPGGLRFTLVARADAMRHTGTLGS